MGKQLISRHRNLLYQACRWCTKGHDIVKDIDTLYDDPNGSLHALSCRQLYKRMLPICPQRGPIQ